MQRRGFRPKRIAKGSKVEFVLGRCPFEEVAASNPDAVCQLHRGLAEGLAEGLGGVQVERLMVKNPRRAGAGWRCDWHPPERRRTADRAGSPPAARGSAADQHGDHREGGQRHHTNQPPAAPRPPSPPDATAGPTRRCRSSRWRRRRRVMDRAWRDTEAGHEDQEAGQGDGGALEPAPGRRRPQHGQAPPRSLRPGRRCRQRRNGGRASGRKPPGPKGRVTSGPRQPPRPGTRDCRATPRRRTAQSR